MLLKIDHTTAYRFDPPMRGVTQSLRVWPSVFDGQTIHDWSVSIDGAVRGASFRDGAGDLMETATLLGPVSAVDVVMRGTVETTDTNGILKNHGEKVPPQAYLRPTSFTRPDAALKELALETVSDISETDILDRAHALAKAVRREIDYSPGETSQATTAADALAARKGVCQDHTHALIAVANVVGIPARYVTGYLHVSGDDLSAEASHAWAELHVPDLGWLGFDASNGVAPNEQYVRLGSGLNALDAAPIRGIAQGSGTESLSIDVSVEEAAQQ